MTTKRHWLLVLSSLAGAVIIPLMLRLLPPQPQTHHIALEAKKYGYSPARIVVNRGDTVILKPTSLDVTHGFLLDGYPVEFIIKQQGIAYLKYSWEDENGSIQSDWDRVAEIEFAAEKSGKFIFRCNQTCGNLHPFMTGELIVRPNTPYHLFVSLSIWLTLNLLLWFRRGRRPERSKVRRTNLLEKMPWLGRLIGRRGFQFLLILPNFIVFYLFILSSLWGSPVGNRNIAIIFVWIAWWFVLKAVLVPLGGRLWCLICPLPAPAEWLSRKRITAVRYFKEPFRKLHHRFTGLQKDWPRKLDNIWLQNILFMTLISFGIILITRPVATAILFLAILAATFVVALIFRRRVFCLYLCPVGGFLGTYSMASVTEVRPVEPEVCKQHKEKECYVGGLGNWACPWNQYVGKLKRNNYCGLCTECIKGCPKQNVGLFLRPFGSDRVLRGYDEMFNAAIMLAVAIVFSITMLGPWGFIKDAANVTENRDLVPYLAYLAAVWGLALVVLPGLTLLTGKGANRLAGNPVSDRTMTLRVAYTLIPLGIFFWIAFSLPPVMTNYGYILAVLSDPLGLGWDIFGTANYPFKPFLPQWIPLLQGVIFVAGLYLALSRGHSALRDVVPQRRLGSKAMLLPSLLALLLVNILLRLYLG